MALISLQNVTFSYDKQVDVIINVNLEVNQGENIAIIGHNGSGKSTLAKLFNALVLPDKGQVVVDGVVTSQDKKAVFEVRKKVGVVFQNPDNQLIASIVEDDVAFGPENLGVKREEIAKRIDFALDAVNMQEFRHSSPTRLSGGQKQRIAIAGVLALNPKVLVLDESTAMLDPRGRKEVLEVVNKLNKEQNVTVINVTHYMDEVVSCDKVIVLNDGEIAMVGTPKEVFNQVELLEKCSLSLPRARVIANKLKSLGLDINGDILTEVELGEALCKLM